MFFGHNLRKSASYLTCLPRKKGRGKHKFVFLAGKRVYRRITKEIA